MIRYYCDRCNKNMGSWTDEDTVVLPAKKDEYIQGVRHSYGPEEYQLCHECVELLRLFFIK